MARARQEQLRSGAAQRPRRPACGLAKVVAVEVVKGDGHAPASREADQAGGDGNGHELPAGLVVANVPLGDLQLSGQFGLRHTQLGADSLEWVHGANNSATTYERQSRDLIAAPERANIALMNQEDDRRTKKQAKVTDENRVESARLLRIYLSKKEQLAAKGLGTQEALGATFGVGQGSVAHFLHGRSAISVKAALGFAKALDCKVADFSTRLARVIAATSEEDLDELIRARAGAAPKSKPASAPTPAPARVLDPTAGSGALLINVLDALEHVAATLDAVPDQAREPIGRELSLLASVPDSKTLVRRIAGYLEPYDRPSTPRSLEAASNAAQEAANSMGGILGRRLDEVADVKQRRALFALLDGLIDRVVHDSNPEVINALAESTRELQPMPAPSTLP
jgi:hypothetical protein